MGTIVSTTFTIILGAFLGFVATLTSAQLTDQHHDKAKKKSHAQYLRLEMEGTLKTLDQIKTGYEHQRFYDFLLLDLLDGYVNNLQEARKQAYLMSDEKLRTQTFNIINRISILSKDMRGIQNHTYAKNETTDDLTGVMRPMNPTELDAKKALIHDKIQGHFMEILDLKREVNDFIEQLDADK